MVEATDMGEKRQHLQTLSLELALRGFEVDVRATRTGVPLLVVTNPAQPALLCENIACVADVDGVTRFAWPWGSYLADVGSLSTAAAEVLRVLGVGDG